MGNNQNTVEKHDIYDHPRLGKVMLDINEKTNTTTIAFSRPVQSQLQYDEWIKQKQRLQNYEISEVVFLPRGHTYQKQGMCGSSGTVKFVFEDYLFCLQHQIKNRRQLDKPFSETEMWYLLYNIVRAGKQFEKYDKKIGSVHPYNVVINEDGHIKLISTISWPEECTNYDKVIQNRDQKVYLAPEECVEQCIKKGEYPFKVRKIIAETFSIGVTLLEAATLQSCEDLYTKVPYSFNITKLNYKKSLLKNYYSEMFMKTLQNMLEVNEHERPTCGEIHAVLLPYEQSILNLEEFEPNKIASQKSLTSYKNTHDKTKKVINEPQKQVIKQLSKKPSKQQLSSEKSGFYYQQMQNAQQAFQKPPITNTKQSSTKNLNNPTLLPRYEIGTSVGSKKLPNRAVK